MYEHMTPCERIGIAGGCGLECYILLEGDCHIGLEILQEIPENDRDEDLWDLLELYGDDGPNDFEL